MAETKSIGVGIESVFSRRRIYFFSHSLLTASRSHSFTLTHSLTHINTRKFNHCISRIHLSQTHSRTCILRWKRVRKILYIGSSQFGFSRVNEPKKKTKTKQPISAEVRFSRLLLTKNREDTVGKSLELYTVRETI